MKMLLASLLFTFVASLSGSAMAGQPQIVTDALGAAEWMSKALASSGYKADFSVESLREVDRFFDEQAPGGKPRPRGLLSEQLGQRIFGLGSYVGEVIRRQAGGEWQGNDADSQAEINVAVKLKNGSLIWPVQRVMKRFKNGSEDGIYAYGIVLLEK
ncbi:MAG TPA: hypothetical protein VHY80_05440 [Stellaceae bacterium]|nr:hypothetical protein [Stellaceae bacterium]